MTCHMTIIKLLGTRKPQDLLLGKNSFCFRSPSERYCQSFICSEQTFDPGLKPLELLNRTGIFLLNEAEYLMKNNRDRGGYGRGGEHPV